MPRRRPRPFRNADRRRAGFPSALEPLEERRVPATLTVNTLLDLPAVDPSSGNPNTSDGTISLRSAIQAANATADPTNIIVPAGTYPQTIPVSGSDGADSGDLNITGKVTLVGEGSDRTIIDAGANDRVLTVSGGPVVLFGLEITNGFAPRLNGVAQNGGGIKLSSGSLTLTNCLVDGNRAAGDYGGSGGGIFVEGGDLTLNSTLVDNNQAFNTGDQGTSRGGGLYSTSEAGITLNDSVLSNNIAGRAQEEREPDDGEGGGIFNAGGRVSLTRTSVRDNQAIGNGVASRGGGIFQTNLGTLDLLDSTLANNRASINFQARVANGGGIFNDGGTVTLMNSTITDSRVGAAFGGIASGSGGGERLGGGIYNRGRVSLTNSTVSNNRAAIDYGGYGGVDQGGGIYNTGTATLTNSTISTNFATNGGGGIASIGGTLVVLDCTISGNSTTGNGGGILIDEPPVTPKFVDGFEDGRAPGSITGATIANNTTSDGDGKGIFFRDNATTTIRNTVLHNPGSSSNYVGISDRLNIFSLGHNLVSDDASEDIFNKAGDVNDIDPLLGPLEDNGGPTLTQAPQAGSPLIDAGDSADPPSTDQRGLARINGGEIDIGAVETQGGMQPATANLGVVVAGSTPSVTAGDNVVYTVNVTNNGPSPAADVVLTNTLPASGADFLNASGGVLPVGGILTFQLGTLPVGGTAVASIHVRATSAGTLTVAAQASSATPGTAGATSTSTTVNPAPVPIPTPAAALAVGVAGPTDSLTVGTPSTFSVTVSNGGQGVASGVTVVVPIPPVTAFGSATGGAIPSGGLLTLPVGDLAPGASMTLSVILTPRVAGDLTLQATASSADAPPVTGSVTTTASPGPVVVPPPSIVAIQRYGFHAQPTLLYLPFSTALESASATTAANFAVYRLNRHGAKIGRAITPSAATYNPTLDSVTLSFAQRLKAHQRYALLVNGSAPGAVSGPGGLLNGNGTGAGTNFESTFDMIQLAGRASDVPGGTTAAATLKRAGPGAAAVDALFGSGKFTFRKAR